MKRLLMLTALTLLTSTMGCGEGEEAPSGEEPRPMAVEQAVLHWTGSTSEEDPPAHCAGTTVAFGIGCGGYSCDHVTVGCKDALPGATFGNVTWTQAFSEETSTPTLCPNGSWVTGLSCSGGYCDNISLECTAIAGRTASWCDWSSNVSDETSVWRAPDGYYIRGARCTGWWCDDLSFYYCKMI